MSKSYDREAARRDLERLLKGLTFYRDWRIFLLKQASPAVPEAEIEDQVVIPAAMWLAAFDGARGGRYTQVIDEVRNWYAHSLAELLHFRRSTPEARVAVEDFLQRFEAEVGYSFQSESGAVREIGQAVLEAGRIISGKQYHVLKEIGVDPSSGLFTTAEVSKILTLLEAFEDSRQRR